MHLLGTKKEPRAMLTTWDVIHTCLVNQKVPFLLAEEENLGPLNHWQEKQSKTKELSPHS